MAAAAHAATSVRRALVRVLCLLLMACGLPATAQHLLLDSAQRRALAGQQTEATVTLPDLQLAREMASGSTHRYRLRFDGADLRAVLQQPGLRAPSGPDEPLGLFVERACQDMSLHINGVTLQRRPASASHRVHDCQAPQLVAIPPSLLREGLNEIDIEISGWPLAWVSSARRAIGLSAVRIGAYDDLDRRHQRASVLSSELPATGAAAALLTGLLILSLMAFAPQPHLAYFAALAVVWSAIHMRAAWSGPLDSPLLHEGLLVMLNCVAVWAFQRFAWLYADLQRGLIDRLSIGLLLVMPVALVIGGSQRMFIMAALGHLCCAALVAATMAVFVFHARQSRRRPMKAISAVFGLALLLVVGEFLVSTGLTQALAQWPLQPGLALCLLLLGVLQMAEFGRQAQLTEGMQRQLERKIAMARQEIEASFDRLNADRLEQVAAVERKRIAADLHDDLGAKLLTIVHTSRSDRIAALGREALDEMRLSVRGLTGRPMALAEALADWRTEAMSRLTPTGIELEWPLPLEDMPQVLGARSMVQTTRILREVFNNLIRHSQANRCTVHTEVQSDRLKIEITDNGQGFEIERLKSRQSGLGLLSMQHRAKQLQGECRIESQPGQGSRVSLSLPLQGLQPGPSAP